MAADQNGFLRAFPDFAFEALSPVLEIVTLRDGMGTHLHPRLPDGHYFPIDCVLVALRDAGGEEPGFLRFIGPDGFVRVDADTDHRDVIVVGPGSAAMVSGAAVRRIVESRPEWGRWAFELSRVRNASALLNIACAAGHNYRQRVARLLLEAHGAFRSGDGIRLTHQRISHLLATRRETVTVVIAELVRDGLIETGRGRVHVRDPSALERVACRCVAEARAIEERALVVVKTFFT